MKKTTKIRLEKVLLGILTFMIIAIALILISVWNNEKDEVEITQATTETTTMVTTDAETTTDAVPDNSIDARELVAQMGAGWNLGNTMDAYDNKVAFGSENQNYDETLWGNPMTTNAMITMVKIKGFTSVRIPVTYYNHVDANGNVDQKWLDRVAEVVQYVLDNQMICIIDIHHDTGASGWIQADLDNYQTNQTIVTTMITDIATYFKEYPQELVLEGFNEILNQENTWEYPESEAYEAANQWNQLFVDVVRSTGGGNLTRCLLLNTYAAGINEDAVKNFVLPEDSAKNKLIVGVHFYGTDGSTYGDNLDRLVQTYLDNGIPVLIGEYGTALSMEISERINLAKTMASAGSARGIPCFWWDDGSYQIAAGALCNYALLDKVALEWKYPDIADAWISAYQ